MLGHAYVILQPNTAWRIFSNPRRALEALTCSPKHSVSRQLIIKTYPTCQEATLSEQTIVLQWIPSHCGARGNVLANLAATAGH